MVPLHAGHLSEQVAHRRGSMGGLLLQVLRILGPMELVLVLVVLGGLSPVAVGAGRSSKKRELARADAEVAPVKKLAEEDVTALGVELQDLDIDLAGHQLDAGANADYQRALDAYESAKTAAAALTRPDDVSTSPRSSRTVATRWRACAPGWRGSRCRSAARRASSTPATACRSPTCRGRRRAARRATCPPARSTSSACAQAPSPTSAR